MLENGEATLEFFTSDIAGKFRVIAEGISSNGKACYGTTLLDVGISKE